MKEYIGAMSDEEMATDRWENENCPVLDSALSRVGRSSECSINTQTGPSAKKRSLIGRCSESPDEHKKATRNGKMTI